MDWQLSARALDNLKLLLKPRAISLESLVCLTARALEFRIHGIVVNLRLGVYVKHVLAFHGL